METEVSMGKYDPWVVQSWHKVPRQMGDAASLESFQVRLFGPLLKVEGVGTLR